MNNKLFNVWLLCGVFLLSFLCEVNGADLTAKLVFDNPKHGSFLIGESRGRGAYKANLRNSAGKQTIIEIDSSTLCTNKLFLVFFDGALSWIKVTKGDKIMISQNNGKIITKGGNQAINDYLNTWTEKSYLNYACPLLVRIAGMELNSLKSSLMNYSAENYSDPKTISYLSRMYADNLTDLKSSGIKDSDFIKEHTKRIKYQWMESVLYCYATSEQSSKPVELANLLNGFNLDDKWMMSYPGRDDMLRFYVQMKINLGAIKLGAKSYLVDQAFAFSLPEMRERFLINELEIIDKAKLYLFFEESISLVSPYITSSEGVSKVSGIKDNYSKFINSQANKNNIPALDFKFLDRNNKIVSLSDFKGKYVVIDLWATWCSPCKFQIPFLKRMENKFHGRNVQFISVSTDKQADRELWINFIDSNDMNGVSLITPNAFDCDFVNYYNVRSIPRFMLVGKNGDMLSSDFRRPSDPVFEAQLEYLLSK